ncbi:MAG: hypothetical protein ACHBN1_30260 [Heteroscytonema crispum UTEX LB 1556]
MRVGSLLERLNGKSQQQVSPQNNQQLSPTEQAWMLTVQQIQDELTQTRKL